MIITIHVTITCNNDNNTNNDNNDNNDNNTNSDSNSTCNCNCNCNGNCNSNCNCNCNSYCVGHPRISSADARRRPRDNPLKKLENQLLKPRPIN